jgi:acyl-CoA reductase-like NAD-dependent aldehyde dehydrogenase
MSMTPAQRARLLLKLADLIEANADEIALLETLDNGMPYRMANSAACSARRKACVITPAGPPRFMARPSTQFPGEWHAYTLREPVGVVGQIVPWNFPFVMGVAKIAPALAVGCTVVLKPAEQTPLTTIRLGELIAEAGFPRAWSTSSPALAKPRAVRWCASGVDKIAFTGSTSVARKSCGAVR